MAHILEKTKERQNASRVIAHAQSAKVLGRITVYHAIRSIKGSMKMVPVLPVANIIKAILLLVTEDA